MEGFAIKIDKNLKSNLCKICRLCGIDHPDKIKVNEKNTVHLDDEDQELCVKIFICIGVRIKNDDQMPQTICTICFDKINDFFEFREMCSTTQSQTRILLGLPEEKTITANIKSGNNYSSGTINILTKQGPARKRKINDGGVMDIISTKIKNNLSENIQTCSKNGIPPVLKKRKAGSYSGLNTEREIKLEKKSKNSCSICLKDFDNILQREEHMKVNHIPAVVKYHCVYCDETLYKPKEIKSHNLMHKLSKTPFQCGCCLKKIYNLYTYSKHIRDCIIINNCKLVPDKECSFCSKRFPTAFLFNIHPCIINRKNKKCLNTKEEMVKHVPYCSQTTRKTPDIANLRLTKLINTTTPQATLSESKPYPGMLQQYIPQIPDIQIKTEIDDNINLNNKYDNVINPSISMSDNQFVVIPPNISLNVNTSSTRPIKKNKRVTKEHLKRIDDLIKNTITTLDSIKQEPIQYDPTPNVYHSKGLELGNENQVDYDDNNGHDDNHIDDHQNYESDNDCDNNMISDNASLVVKQEIIDESYRGLNESIAVNIKQEVDVDVNTNGLTVPNELRLSLNDNINNEPIYKPGLKLKIKKEHGQLNSTIIDNFTNGKSKKKKKSKSEKHSTCDEHLSNSILVKPLLNENVPFPPTISIKQEMLDNESMHDTGVILDNANESYSVNDSNLIDSETPEYSHANQIKIHSVLSGFNFSDHKYTSSNCIDSSLPLITSVSSGVQIPSLVENNENTLPDSSYTNSTNVPNSTESSSLKISLISSNVVMPEESIPNNIDEMEQHVSNSNKSSYLQPEYCTENNSSIDEELHSLSVNNLKIKREIEDPGYDYSGTSNSAIEDPNDHTMSEIKNQDLIFNGHNTDSSQHSLEYISKNAEMENHLKTKQISKEFVNSNNNLQCEDEYIRNIDFENIQIKQEIEFTEETVYEQQLETVRFKDTSTVNDDDDDGDDDEKDDDNGEDDEDEEIVGQGQPDGQYPDNCEYRELEIFEEIGSENVIEEISNRDIDSKEDDLQIRCANNCSVMSTSNLIPNILYENIIKNVDRLENISSVNVNILHAIDETQNISNSSDYSTKELKNHGLDQKDITFNIPLELEVQEKSKKDLELNTEDLSDSLIESMTFYERPTTSQSSHLINYENANEIAENNNNANIEKELSDEHVC